MKNIKIITAVIIDSIFLRCEKKILIVQDWAQLFKFYTK